jgi:signal transduction histidine kinase/response regulator of citrate/malate metabolism
VFDKRTVRRIFPFYNKAINGIHTEGEVRYKKYIYHIVASTIKNKDNETVAGILVSQNITKDKQLEENLIKSREEARKADKAKSIFLANMSHEIRTPLNSIAGFTEQLNKTDLNGQQQKLVSLINNASEHLLYIVNEIIILFKLGMDKVHIEKIAFSIDELLEELHDIFKKQANEKGLSFKVDIDDKLPGTLNGDPFRLRQILMNLLINAVKYTDKGEIKLSCKMLSETAKSVELLFEVSDTGIGIDKKDMPNIFDVFEQGNKRTERIRGGAGLGLGICKKLVDLFNGQIFVESKLHKGSTFSVQIPFKKSKLTKIRKKEKNFSLEDNLLSRKKILLADDDEHNLLLAEMILKGWDTDFILAKNGKEATGILKDKKFDLILLDIHMPKRSGVQVIKALRSSKNGLNHSTPALALTANVLKADLNRYLKAGFNGYVKKPYKETNLYSKICNILQLEPGNHNTTKIQKSSIDKSSRLNSFEIEELKNVSKGDKVFFNKMIDNFANNAETLLIAFNSGIENKDLEEIGEKAHKAIPSFRFFKLNNIAASLEEIEHVALKQKRFTGLPEIIGQAEIEIKSAIQQAKASKK